MNKELSRKLNNIEELNMAKAELNNKIVETAKTLDFFTMRNLFESPNLSKELNLIKENSTDFTSSIVDMGDHYLIGYTFVDMSGRPVWESIVVDI